MAEKMANLSHITLLILHWVVITSIFVHVSCYNLVRMLLTSSDKFIKGDGLLSSVFLSFQSCLH